MFIQSSTVIGLSGGGERGGSIHPSGFFNTKLVEICYNPRMLSVHHKPMAFSKLIVLITQGHSRLVLSICVICLTGVSGVCLPAPRPPPAAAGVCFDGRILRIIT